MTDLLSGLRKPDEPGNWPVGGPLTLAYNQALDDVQEVLRNPTVQQTLEIDDVWRTYHYSVYDTISGQFRCACGEPKQDDSHRIRVYLAAAAGGDDD